MTKSKLSRWLALTALLLLGVPAQAAVTCSVSSSGFSTAVNAGVAASVQTSFTVTCTATAGEASVNYSVAANNGMYANGINNRAMLAGPSYMKYDAYVDAGCGIQWKGNTTIAGTIVLAGSAPVSRVHSYWGCVAAQTGLAAGTYSDTVTMTVSWGNNPQPTATSTFPVNIATPATCSITSAPGNVAFGAYVAFGGALAASTAFGATCTNYLPYTLAVTPTTGTIAGVSYLLELQNAAPVMNGTTLSVTGNGFQQNYTINGAMAAGQGGICPAGTCSGAVPHTLTLTY